MTELSGTIMRPKAKQERGPQELALSLLRGHCQDVLQALRRGQKKRARALIRRYKKSPACLIVDLALHMTAEEQTAPTREWCKNGCPDEIALRLCPLPKRRKNNEQTG